MLVSPSMSEWKPFKFTIRHAGSLMCIYARFPFRERFEGSFSFSCASFCWRFLPNEGSNVGSGRCSPLICSNPWVPVELLLLELADGGMWCGSQPGGSTYALFLNGAMISSGEGKVATGGSKAIVYTPVRLDRLDLLTVRENWMHVIDISRKRQFFLIHQFAPIFLYLILKSMTVKNQQSPP